MGIFAARRQAPLTDPTPVAVPVRFEAVAEALASGLDAADACTTVGRMLSRDGTSLQEGLDDLRLVHLLVRGTDPSYDAVNALAVAWSESTLGYLHQISCADAMTGLATLAHLRTRLSDLYRVETPTAPVRLGYALVVAGLPIDPLGVEQDRIDVLSRSLRMARLGEAAHTVFPHAETITGVGSHRVLVLTQRHESLGRRAALLRRMIDTLDLHSRQARVWIEGLPSTDAGAVGLLDELARV